MDFGDVFEGDVPQMFWAYGTIIGIWYSLAKLALWGEHHLFGYVSYSGYYLYSQNLDSPEDLVDSLLLRYVIALKPKFIWMYEFY